MRFEALGLAEACRRGHLAVVDWLLSNMCAESVAKRIATVSGKWCVFSVLELFGGIFVSPWLAPLAPFER